MTKYRRQMPMVRRSYTALLRTYIVVYDGYKIYGRYMAINGRFFDSHHSCHTVTISHQLGRGADARNIPTNSLSLTL